MTKNEKRLSTIALVILIGYMLPFLFVPTAYKFYNDYWQSLEKLHQNIERYEKLAGRAEHWEAENQRVKKERDEIKASLLPGDTHQLVSAKMQALVRQLAQNAGITFKSLDTPDNTTYSTGEWVFVIQSMQFEGNGKTLMTFLTALDDNPVKLEVISLEVRSRGKKLTGTIKVTGFSRLSSNTQE
ncbi:MAG: GspMb/PilO family protein [Pseudomonadota bacterium]